MKFQGTAKLYINGREVATMKGSSFSTGGVNRNPVTGQEVYGFSEEPINASLTCQIPNEAGFSIADVNAMTDVTITFVPDSGKTWLMPNAWSNGNAQLTDNGAISVSFSAKKAKEI